VRRHSFGKAGFERDEERPEHNKKLGNIVCSRQSESLGARGEGVGLHLKM
jgi:hypothetical protein